jgi:signal transduction histidine kinase
MDPEAEASERERRDLTAMADIAELAGPLAHEVNNFLNALLLHLAVIELSVPEKVRADVIEVRRQGQQLGDLVRQWQQQRRHEGRETHAVRLNDVAAAVVATVRAEAADTPIDLQAATDPPPIMASQVDVERLCKFLLANAVSAARLTNGSVTIRLEPSQSRLLLYVEDQGPPLAAQALPHYFEPDRQRREGTDPLQLAACHNIVRRLHGAIRAENAVAGGVKVVVELPVASANC